MSIYIFLGVLFIIWAVLAYDLSKVPETKDEQYNDDDDPTTTFWHEEYDNETN